jgi:hypothetical protein
MNPVAGALTLAALVGFGLFVYPWLLRRGRVGALVVGLVTIALAGVFAAFDADRGTPWLSAALGTLWSLLPVATALVGRWATRPRKPSS